MQKNSVERLNFQSISLDLEAHTATITFAPAASSPSSTGGTHGTLRPFSWIYLRLQKTASMRPGSGFTVSDSTGPCPLERGYFQIEPASDDSVSSVAVLKWH